RAPSPSHREDVGDAFGGPRRFRPGCVRAQAQQARDDVRRVRLAEPEALPLVAPEGEEVRVLLLALDALGDGAHAERVREADDMFDDGRVLDAATEAG